MKKRIFSILLALCMALTFMPTAAMAGNTSNNGNGAQTTFEAIDGTQTNYQESFYELTDGNKNKGKWCVTGFGNEGMKSIYVIIKASDAVKLTAYQLTTGNDDLSNRNPKSWTLYASNKYNEYTKEYNSDIWTQIDKVENDTSLPTTQYTSKKFDIENSVYYQYYKLEINANQATDVVELGEIEFVCADNQCKHQWKSETDTKTQDYNSCASPTYINKECTECKTKIENIVLALPNHSKGEDGKCSVCSNKIEKSVSDGFMISGGVEGKDKDYTYENGVLTVLKSVEITIKNTNNNPTSHRIVIAKDVSANIVLDGVNIDLSNSSDTAAICIENDSTGNVTITLAENSVNTLKSGEKCAGLQKNCNLNSKGTLEIKGTGQLSAEGGRGGAGIGSGWIDADSIGYGSNNITISGGKIIAEGGYYGAGIGGGYCGSVSKITVSDGIVIATGCDSGAGIGSGEAAEGKDIFIIGGSVNAVAGNNANAIGGGYSKSSVNPTLLDELTPVYRLEIENADGKRVFIDADEYKPYNHTAADSKDTKLYVYITGENHKIKIGDTEKNYYFNGSSFELMYTVVFKTDGGSAVPTKNNLKWNDKVLEGVINPTKDGYTFLNWKYGDIVVDENTTYEQLASNNNDLLTIELSAQWNRKSSSSHTTTQKPTITFANTSNVLIETAADGSTVYTTAEGKLVLSKDGTTASITAADGYEVANVSVNGTDKGAVTTLTGLKTGDKIVVTFKQTAEAQSKAEIAQIKSMVEKMSLTARSTKTAKKNIKITLKTDKDTTAAIKEIKSLGYTVKYKYYRSTKKASKYAAKATKTSKSYTNTSGKKGTKYYYKARVQVYNADGKLVAQTALKQCKYATRQWSK